MPRQKQSKPKRLEEQRAKAKGLLHDKDDVKSGSGKDDEEMPAKRARLDAGKKANKRKAKKSESVRTTRSKAVKKRLKLKLKERTQPQRIAATARNNDKLSVKSQKTTESEMPTIDDDSVVDKYDFIKSRSAKLAKTKDSPVKSTEQSPPAPALERHRSMRECRVGNTSDTEMPILEPVDADKKDAENSTMIVNKEEGGKLTTENMTAHEALSRKFALEALLQITHTELHTLSAQEQEEQLSRQRIVHRQRQLMIQQHQHQQQLQQQQQQHLQHSPRGEHVCTTMEESAESESSAATGTCKPFVKCSDSDKGIVKYQLKSETLEEQGLKLVYTAQTGDRFEHNPISYGAYRPRKSSKPLDPMREVLKKDNKPPKKPGRHICQFCGRGCAKPSVLKKHIRSHTNERPYPCNICGFAFKTKSNLYKHKKSHAHAIKAGLAPNLDEATKIIDYPDNIDDSEGSSDEEDDSGTEGSPESSHSQSQLRRSECEYDDQVCESHISASPPYRHYVPGHPIPEGAVPVYVMPVAMQHVYPSDPGKFLYDTTMPSMMGHRERHDDVRTGMMQRFFPSQAVAPNVKYSDVTMVKQNEASTEAKQESTETPQETKECDDVSKNEESEQPSSSSERGPFHHENVAGFQIDMQTGKSVPVTHNLTPQPTVSTAGKLSTSEVPSPGSGVATPTTPKNIDRQSLHERIKQLISQNEAIVDNPMLESVKPRRMSGPKKKKVPTATLR